MDAAWASEFESHGAAEPGVFGLIDDAHSTAAEFFKNAVMGNRGAEKRVGGRHAQRILVSRRGASQTTWILNGQDGLVLQSS